MIQVVYTKLARQDLRNMPVKTAQRIIKKIEFYRQQNNCLMFAKKLAAPLTGYRFRIGSYRVIFDYDDQAKIKVLAILRIKHRKDIYRL